MRTILLFLILLINAPVFSQKQGLEAIDSMLNVYKNAQNDTVKARILNKVSLYYNNINPDFAFKYTRQGMTLVNKMNWDRGRAAFYTCLGNIYTQKGKLDSAIISYKNSLSLHTKIKDKDGICVDYINLGASENARSNFPEAIQYYQFALHLAEELKNNQSVGLTCYNLALAYQYQDNIPTAIGYLKRSIRVNHLSGNESQLITIYTLYGDLLHSQKQYVSADSFYNVVLKLALKYDNKLGEANVLNSMGTNYFTEKKYRQGIKYLTTAKSIYEQLGENSESALINLGFLGSEYSALAQLVKKRDKTALKQTRENAQTLLSIGILYLNKAVSKFKIQDNFAQQAQFQEDLATAYEMSGDYKNAYLNYRESKQIQDSIFSQKNKNEIAAIENKYVLDAKNREIEQQKATVANQKKNMLFLLLGLIAVIIVGLLYYRLSRLRKQRNLELSELNKQLDNANKVKAKFFAILSHDLRSPIANLIHFIRLGQTDKNLMSKMQKSEQEDKITRSATALLDSMESMLLWGKGQMENFVPEKTQVRITGLFTYIQDFFSSYDSVNFTFEDANELIAYTDENYLKTIMQNITQNALNAMKSVPNPTITWKGWKKENNCYLSIADNGPGISNMEIRQFEEDDVSVQSSKNGLGLYIVKEMAKAINCNITVQSSREGTTFFLEIKNTKHSSLNLNQAKL